MTLAMSTTHDTEQQFSKSTLFCPTCEHASPIDGDWIMDDAVARERLCCPSCGEIVADHALC